MQAPCFWLQGSLPPLPTLAAGLMPPSYSSSNNKQQHREQQAGREAGGQVSHSQGGGSTVAFISNGVTWCDMTPA
jgi:hypothetical protein